MTRSSGTPRRSRHRPYGYWCAHGILVSAVLVLAHDSVAQVDGRLSMVLENGLLVQSMLVELDCRKGTWDERIAVYPGEQHTSNIAGGVVKTAQPAGSGANLTCSILLDGGWSEYKLELKFDGSEIGGTYTGQYLGIAVGGAVRGTVEPFVDDYVPVKAGEHPRLLFRKSQIPWLKDKAENTPQGRAAITRLRQLLEWDRKGFSWGFGPGRSAPQYCEGQWAAGHAFLYALYGRPEDLERAKQITSEAMTVRGGEMGGWGDASRWAGVALAYDMCYYAWDESFRKDVRSMLRWFATYSSTSVNHFSAMFWSAGGLAGLATRGDPEALPPRPPSPSEVTRTIAPADGPTTGDVPLVPFTSDMMFRDWLWAGSVEPLDGEDPLASIGGRHGARPVSGTSFTYRGNQYSFVPTTGTMTTQLYGLQSKIDPPNPAFSLYGAPSDCPGEVFREHDCYRYYYTMLDNEAERNVLAFLNDPGFTFGVSMWINGERVVHGEVVKLAKGKYPVMVELPLRGLWAAPRLVEYSHAKSQTEWGRIAADLEGFGGASGFGEAMSEARAASVVDFARQKIAANGQVLGGYDPWGSWGVMPSAADMMHTLLPFAQAYRNVTGVDFAAATNIPQMVPHVMSGGTFYDDFGSAWWRVMGFYDIFPEDKKPQLRIRMDERTDLGIALAWHAMFALLNYPWPGEDGPPTPQEWNEPTMEAGRVRTIPSVRSWQRPVLERYSVLGRRIRATASGNRHKSISHCRAVSGVVIERRDGVDGTVTRRLVGGTAR